MAMNDNKDSSATHSVFEPGYSNTKTIKLKKSDDSSPPVDLFLVAPTDEGSYPVLLFCHSYCTKSSWYSDLLRHVSSHGYIVVAPQFYRWLLICTNDEIKKAAKVTNWLTTAGLSCSLPEKVKPDLSKLALMGHSRGGKIAFGLALGHAPEFKALLAIDPVCGPSPPTWIEPRILTYIPHSFQLSIPVGVIGTGLSNQSTGVIPRFPPLCPDGFNHAEFFNESKPPCCYFLARDYGHCDVLDESKASLASLVCKSGKGCKEKMRRGVGGIVVAFLKAYLGDGEFQELEKIVDSPNIAPITLDPVIHLRA